MAFFRALTSASGGGGGAATVRIYSAANDTVTVSDGSNSVTYTTNSNGYADNCIIPTGVITVTSSVAPDIDTLSGNYSRTLYVNSSNTAIYVMPDNTLYWYGYVGNIESMTNENGWAGTKQLPTYNPRSITIAGASYVECGVASKIAVRASKVHTIAQCTQLAGGNSGVIGATLSKSSGWTDTLALSNTSVAHSQLSISDTTNDHYIALATSMVRAFVVSAFWYEE